MPGSVFSAGDATVPELKGPSPWSWHSGRVESQPDNQRNKDISGGDKCDRAVLAFLFLPRPRLCASHP